MNEAAFIVKEDSNLYKNYFKAKKEKDKFKKLAYEFFKKNNLLDHELYELRGDLHLSLTEEQKELYKDQICQKPDNHGIYKFKYKSQLNTEWINEVSSKIDFNTLRLNDVWYWDYISNGKYSMFDYNGKVYGYLLDNNHDEVALDDRVKRIKMSEFWKVKEEIAEKEGEINE